MGIVLVTAAHGSDHRCGQRPSEPRRDDPSHPVGTCRMGRAVGSVVDADLKLNGFRAALRGHHASETPALDRGNVDRRPRGGK